MLSIRGLKPPYFLGFFMNCVLYHNESQENKLNKVLTNKGTRIILFLESVDFLRPRITVKSLPTETNYVYIESLGRYYFISDIKNLKNELFELNLRCDVLMTYKQDIEETQAIITESTNEINSHNVGYVAEKDIETSTVNLENPFSEDSDVLITIVGN